MKLNEFDISSNFGVFRLFIGGISRGNLLFFGVIFKVLTPFIGMFVCFMLFVCVLSFFTVEFPVLTQLVWLLKLRSSLDL